MTPLGPWPSFGPLGGHLGSRLDALADGQVGPEERERLLAHAAGCPGCRSELRAAREVKAKLGRLTQPEVPSDLTSRLLSLPGMSSGPLGGSAAAPAPGPGFPSRFPAPAALEPVGAAAHAAHAVHAAHPAHAAHRRFPGAAASIGLLVGVALLAAVPATTPTPSRSTTRPLPAAVRGATAGVRAVPATADAVRATAGTPARTAAVPRRISWPGPLDPPPQELQPSSLPPLLAATLHR